MKHVSFSGTASSLLPGLPGTSTVDPLCEGYVAETNVGQDMMQEGFKKFRRRARRAASSDEGAAIISDDDLRPLDETQVEIAAPLPRKQQEQSRLPMRVEPWHQLPQIPFDFKGEQRTRLPLVSAFRRSPTARAFDLLRTRLLHSLKAHGWKRVAVTSATSGAGTTFCAVNLALSLARVPGSRTILMDLNFHTPGLAQALGIAPHGDMARLLTEEELPSQHLQRLSETLAVATNRNPDSDASDLLHDSRTADVLALLIEEMAADTVIFDLPPLLEHDDATAFLPQVDGVLLISDGEQTTAAQLAACEKMLAGHAPLLGVVLNRAQQTDRSQVTA